MVKINNNIRLVCYVFKVDPCFLTNSEWTEKFCSIYPNFSKMGWTMKKSYSSDWKAILIFSLFPGSSHVDIVFLRTPYFLATFSGFVPNYASVFALYFSESDNLVLFKVVIFQNVRLWCNYNVTAITIYFETTRR